MAENVILQLDKVIEGEYFAMEFFSDRELGKSAGISEEISNELFNGILTLYERYQNMSVIRIILQNNSLHTVPMAEQ